ncbi:hypothetical protein KMP13_11475 [Epibacterium ulvae]|uniref:hypothetical protein n=1 Tax=Epibacterium ulvae TaxID=1156985 RepID=UPI001BFC140F|nr:hypothetical protein [Epibacterium ulvae]MBT8154506.1 hypothetical protein [Epibacterium ulvae]
MTWTACYGVVALFAITMTRREQRSHGQISAVNGVLGLALSALWPVAIVMLLASLLWQATPLRTVKAVKEELC